jgi:predicted SAM-dependent methyltransferase
LLTSDDGGGQFFKGRMMIEQNYLNVGCGDKYHRAWSNVDMHSDSPHVRAHDLLRGLPYEDGRFDVVYHSQVLEHIPKDKALAFMRECFRVLAPGGTLRVVVPDLENIAREYLRQLHANLAGPDAMARANYDWIMLELYDQAVRHHSGGAMAEFLARPDLINGAYIVGRAGHVPKRLIEGGVGPRRRVPLRAGAAKLARRCLDRLRRAVQSRSAQIGAFRLGGEIHLWMYDRYSLSNLLAQAGFEQLTVCSAGTSRIPAWPSYELDIKDGQVFDPASLFMEATRPGQTI